MGFEFKKASKKSAWLRAALIGPAGSGKTYSALAVATGLGARVAVIDTEHGSASKYADAFAFDVLELDSFAPRTYVEALQAATAAGYDVVVVDSLSHAWMGKDGALEMVDRAAKTSRSGNSFDAWRSVTPEHNKLVEAMLACRAHLIVTLRAKTEYVLEEDARGKKVPRKVGMAPVQRDGLEYEFDVCGELSMDNELVVTKTRCSALAGQVIARPGRDLAATLRTWLTDGSEPPAPVVVAPTEADALDALMDALDQFKEPSIEQLVGVWLDHKAAITAMSGGEQGPIDGAMGRVTERMPGLTVGAFKNAVLLHEFKAASPQFKEYCQSLNTCRSAEDVATAWRAHAEQIRAWPQEHRELARKLAGWRVQQVDATIKQGGAWLAKQLGDAFTDPPPPRGGKTPPTGTDAPANDAPAAATGDAREATPAQGAQASAEWEAHLATKPNPFAVHASLAKRAAEFRAAGVLDARTRTAMLRVQALIGTTSEMVAYAVLREPSRHYAGKAA